MKAIFTNSFFLAIAIFSATAVSSQTKLPPGQAAKFGIDGDIGSDQADQGNFVATGSHDWFKKANGVGNGLFDTSGFSYYQSQIKSGNNFAFNKKMQYSRYSVQDGVLILDAGYSRDYYGIGPSDALNDKTVFVSTGRESNKNFQNPSTWTTIPTGGTIPNKTDIIDSYVNMRRAGTTITGNNPSDLVLTVGATTLSTDGDKYMDFEFYRERINYNPVTGKFENPVSAATGGHSPWIINQLGDIEKFGDMLISFTFNSSGVTDIILFIWVDYKTYKQGSTNRFDFVENSWNGASAKDGYGYAQIMPNGNYSVKAWGTVNTKTTDGPVWGTSSKDLGNQAGNYSATGYSAGQFAEAGINLTAFGIDPASTQQGMAACDPPFTRFMVKTRSSSAFSSSLQDFTGPYEFLDAPTVPADLVEPQVLTCNLNNVTISPTSYLKGAYYNWSTTDGHISTISPDASSIKVDKPGKYFLTAAIVDGCETTKDSVVVLEDRFKPKATAGVSAPVIFPGSSVLLLGGDPLQSNYSTPFGGSRGLTWSWTSPNGFTSALQNPITLLPGTYTLTIKERRNGCTDVATVSVAPGSTLAVKFAEFTVTADKQKKRNTLLWKMADVSEVEGFVAEKSSNGTDFTTLGYVFADNAITAYSLNDENSGSARYYRIKAIAKAGTHTYSSIIKVESQAQATAFRAYADGAGILTVEYKAAQPEALDIRIVNINGQLVKTVNRKAVAGSNTFKLSEVERPVGGVYLVLVQGQTSTNAAKFKW